MSGMEERIMADRKEFEGLRSEFGDATAKYPMQLADPERLDLAIVYSGIRNNRDAQVAAERIARNYLRINDFDSAQKVFDKMGYTPKQAIKDLENLHTFTGNDEYLETKDFYRAKVFEEQREDIFGNYVIAMKKLGEELSELSHRVMKIQEYRSLKRKMDWAAKEGQITMEKWDEYKESMGKIGRTVFSDYSKYMVTGSVSWNEIEMELTRTMDSIEDVNHNVRAVRDNYKGRMSEVEKYFGMHRERKPKKGFFKRIFGN